jgi:hypothetical protein
MNPYLEHPRIWKDFHSSFLVRMREVLVRDLLPRGYSVSLEETLYARHEWSEFSMFLGMPDIAVNRRDRQSESGGTATLAAPMIRTVPETPAAEAFNFLSIRGADGDDVITVIELLSPTNKRRGADRKRYLRKRRGIFESGTHFVELDFLRGSPRMPMDDPPACDYLAMVSRAETRPEVDVWPIAIRSPLPMIPIPLLGQDHQPVVLQEILHGVYEASGYAATCYRRPPKPPLRPEDAAWADGILKAAGIALPEKP